MTKLNDEFAVFKCYTLIRMLKKTNQDLELALKNYPKNVYEEAVKKLEKTQPINHNPLSS